MEVDTVFLNRMDESTAGHGNGRSGGIGHSGSGVSLRSQRACLEYLFDLMLTRRWGRASRPSSSASLAKQRYVFCTSVVVERC